MKELFNYWYYNDMLTSSGMPTAEQVRLIAEAGVQLVINLAPPDSRNAIPNEGELVNALGMEYINIPVTWRTPEADTLPRFMDTMEAHKDKKIHVHCEANYRASSFIMMYRVLRLGWKKEEAIPIMERVWNPEDFPAWQTFIDEQLKNS